MKMRVKGMNDWKRLMPLKAVPFAWDQQPEH
jgi:hypothetical protein